MGRFRLQLTLGVWVQMHAEHCHICLKISKYSINMCEHLRNESKMSMCQREVLGRLREDADLNQR